MVVRSILCGILSRWNTASLRLIQDSRRSPSIRHICGYFFLNKKQETCSCKKIEMLTSYDGIIHIRLKGRSLMTSSQPAGQAPPYSILNYFIIFDCFCQGFAYLTCTWKIAFYEEDDIDNKALV